MGAQGRCGRFGGAVVPAAERCGENQAAQDLTLRKSVG
jgi:hypothetical protein